MRTLITLSIIFAILTPAMVFSTVTEGKFANALCSEIKDPKVSCHEQYNSRSNIDSTTSSSTEEDNHSAPLLCSDLKCHLGHEYMLDPDNDMVQDPLDFMDY